MQAKTTILTFFLLTLPLLAYQQNVHSIPDGWQRHSYEHVSIAIPGDWKYKTVDMKKQGTFHLHYKGSSLVPDMSITIRLIDDFQKRSEYFRKFDATDLPVDRVKTKAFMSGVNLNILIPPGEKGGQAVEVVIGGVKMNKAMRENILENILIGKDTKDYIAKETIAAKPETAVDDTWTNSENYQTTSNPVNSNTEESYQNESQNNFNAGIQENSAPEFKSKPVSPRPGRMTKIIMCDCGFNLDGLQKWDEGSQIYYTRQGTDIKHGTWQAYFDELNKKEVKECYCYMDGVLQGRHASWYQNGQLEKLLYYQDGKQHGEYKSWYENGALSFEGMYEDGREVGTHWWYNEDGSCNSGYSYDTGNSIPCP